MRARHASSYCYRGDGGTNKELIKNARGGNNERHICEEIADVFIMLSQLEMMFDPQGGEIKKNIHNKTTRLKMRLNQLDKAKKEGTE